MALNVYYPDDCGPVRKTVANASYLRYFYANENTRFCRVIIKPDTAKKFRQKLASGLYLPNIEELMVNSVEGSASSFLFFTDVLCVAEMLPAKR